MRKALAVSLFSLSLVALAADTATFGKMYEQRSDGPKKALPTISLSTASQTLSSGQSTTVFLYATYATGSTPFFYWEADGGSFSGVENDTKVTWKAPNITGGQTFTIHCTIGDGNGNIASAAIPITVGAGGSGGCTTVPATPLFYNPGLWGATSSIDLVWKPTANSKQYILQESTTSAFTSPTSTTFNAPVYSTSLSNKPNGIYYFRVKAKNDCGESGWSNTVLHEVRTNQPPALPSSPMPASGATGISRTPLLQWACSEADGEALEYAVEYGPSPDNLWYIQPYNSSSALNTQAQISWTLNADSTYYWRVRARDERGAETIGPLWNFKTSKDSGDLVPIAVSMTGAAFNGSRVTLDVTVQNQGNLTASDARLRYYFSTAQDVQDQEFASSWRTIPPLQPGQSAIVSTQLTLNQLKPGANFLVAHIDSSNTLAELDLSNNTLSYLINVADSTPPTISYFALQGSSNNTYKTNQSTTISYTVQDNIAPQSVDLAYSTNNGSSWTPIATDFPVFGNGSGNSYQWVIPSSTPLTTSLKLRLTARDASGNPSTSIIGPFTVVDGSAPVLSITSPKSGDIWKLGDTKTLTWTATSPNGIKEVWLSYNYAANSGEWIGKFPGNPGTTTWTIPTLSTLATTNARITLGATDNNGNSTTVQSAAFTVVDASAPPPAPWTMPGQITQVPAISTTYTSQADQSPALAVDAQGNQHLVYVYREDNMSGLQSTSNPTGGRILTSRLYYMKKTGGAWSQPQLLRSATFECDWSDFSGAIDFSEIQIALDANNQPHVVWTEAPYDVSSLSEIYHCYFNGSAWSSPANVSNNSKTKSFTWTTLPYPSVGDNSSAAMRILATGPSSVYATGFTSSRLFYRYNPSANAWSKLADTPTGPISDLVGLNGKVYALSENGDFQAFKESDGTWSTLTKMPNGGQGARMVAHNGLLYVFGANTGAKTQIYNPTANTWANGADMPLAMGYSGVKSEAPYIYLFGGYTPGREQSEILRYDPAANTWLTKTNMVMAAGTIAGADNTMGGRTYIISNTSSLGSAQIEALVPAMNYVGLPAGTLPFRMKRAASSQYGSLYVMDGTKFVSGTLSGTQDDLPKVSYAPRLLRNGNAMSIYWLDGEHEMAVDGSLSRQRAGSLAVHHRDFTPSSNSWGSTSQILTQPVKSYDVAHSATGRHLAAGYYDASINAQRIVHLANSGSAWSTPTTVAPGPGYVCSLGLCADALNNLHLGYIIDGNPRKITYAAQKGGTWSTPQEVLAMPSATSLRMDVGLNNLPTMMFQTFGYYGKDVQQLLRQSPTGQWSKMISPNLLSQNSSMYSETIQPGTNNLLLAYTSWAAGKEEVFGTSMDLGKDFTEPSAALTGLVGGQIATAGQAIPISWTSTDDTAVTSVSLKLSRDGGATFTTLASGLEPSGTTLWTVTAPASTQAILGVFASDAAGNEGSSLSAPFSIAVIPSYSISIAKSGTGNGSVTSSSGPLNCGSLCVAKFTAPTQVTLTAAADGSSSFSGWSGAGTGTTSRVVTVDSDVTVTANFTDNTQPLTISTTGTGTGQISCASGGLSGTEMSYTGRYLNGSQIKLTATPGTGSSFTGWTGTGIGAGGNTANPLTVTMDGAKVLQAQFTAMTFQLSVRAGIGGRIVPSGQSVVLFGDAKTFTVIPDPGYQIDKILIDGVPQAASPTFTLTSIQANKAVVVSFKQK